MRNIMKFVFGVIFSLAFMVTAKAQSDTAGAIPSPDDIVCVQVDENVFECSIMDPNFREGAPGLEEFEEENQMEPGLDTAGVDEGFMDEDDPAVRDFELEDEATGQEPALDTAGMTKDQQVKECERILENQDQSKGLEQESEIEIESETQDEELIEDPSVRGETPDDKNLENEGNLELEEEGTTAPHHDGGHGY